MTDGAGLVVIRPARSQRERWGLLARAQGRALRYWILDTLDAEVTRRVQNVTPPADLPFAALRLGRADDGRLLYSRDAIRRLARANRLPVSFFLGDPAALERLICAWYQQHRAAGGAPDAVAETLARPCSMRAPLEVGDDGELVLMPPDGAGWRDFPLTVFDGVLPPTGGAPGDEECAGA
nr:MAG TPA: hypothetical protein [Caudoviricetes sp.]